MATARVYRPQRDWSGDVIGTIENYYIGSVENVAMGAASQRPLHQFQEVVSTHGMIGVARLQDSGVIVEQGDRLSLDGTWYAVTGPREWDFPNVLTGTVPSYYWVAVESIS